MDEPSVPASEPRRKGRWFDWPLTILCAVLTTLFVRDVLFRQFVVEGSSMQPTLSGGERVLVTRFAYRFGAPGTGDVVVASVRGEDGARFDVIKRIVGVPGETVEVRGCSVVVDGVFRPDLTQPAPCGDSSAPVRVPEEHVYLLGDNRDGSYDSRVFGPVPLDDVVGRVDAVLWPPPAWSRP
jgi:signal peptidase I